MSIWSLFAVKYLARLDLKSQKDISYKNHTSRISRNRTSLDACANYPMGHILNFSLSLSLSLSLSSISPLISQDSSGACAVAVMHSSRPGTGPKLNRFGLYSPFPGPPEAVLRWGGGEGRPRRGGAAGMLGGGGGRGVGGRGSSWVKQSGPSDALTSQSGTGIGGANTSTDQSYSSLHLSLSLSRGPTLCLQYVAFRDEGGNHVETIQRHLCVCLYTHLSCGSALFANAQLVALPCRSHLVEPSKAMGSSWDREL